MGSSPWCDYPDSEPGRHKTLLDSAPELMPFGARLIGRCYVMVATTGAWSGQVAFLRCDGWSPIDVTWDVSISTVMLPRASSVVARMWSPLQAHPCDRRWLM